MANYVRKWVRFAMGWLACLKAKLSNPASSIGKNSRINLSASFCGTRPIRVGDNCSIRNHAILTPGHGSISIGDNCSVGAFNYIDGNGGVVIGDNVRFGPHCAVYSANHGYDREDLPIYKQPLQYDEVVLEDDIWVGSHVVILAGVHVGAGSVIGAGSVVTQNVPARSIVAGVPARLIKERFA